MKICLISKQFYPETIGGAEVYMYEVYKRIRRENEVTILTYDDVDYEEAEIIPVPKVHFILSSFLFSIIAGLKARFGSYDIVHINGYWGEFSGLFVRDPIVTIHDVGFLEKGGVLNRIRFSVLGRVLKSAKKVITVSWKTKEEILRAFDLDGDKIEVIPNGIDTEKYSFPEDMGDEIRRRYGIDDGKIIFSLGRFARNKGYEYLIDAFKDVNQRLKNTHLIIAGYVEDRRYLDELAEMSRGVDNVLLLQEISEDEKLGLFAACDIYCQPSISEEGFGISILEAMASSRPCIATDVFSGVGHLPEEFLVNRGDSRGLANKIIELLSSDYRKIGEKMRRRAENYSWDRTVDEILRVYKEVKIP
ncbi:MAG TPA: glycosyltransferase family 1 protein [Candidatus Syntrophoarchaeum butanivorans]|uniref:Glycosyltransferase family 1 protein n=1 Tax=Candidatus Syntropharchaeum butanivorans TaxID=1839936 RepID=A0A7C1B9F2_9EURY|nr:glycosyltransferase family 1 protein [Candidatus Syntrophoarchaeum butanivorans]